MKKAILNLKGKKITLTNLMEFVGRFRDYQENHTNTPDEIIHFYEGLREQLYFNDDIAESIRQPLFDFVNSEITLANYKKLKIKSLDKPVIRINPSIDAQKLIKILYDNLVKEEWLKCDVETFKRIFIDGVKPLYPIPFWGGQPELTRLLSGLIEKKLVKGVVQSVLIEQSYKKIISEYFIDWRNKPFNLSSLVVSKSKRSDINKVEIVESILKEVHKLF